MIKMDGLPPADPMTLTFTLLSRYPVITEFMHCSNTKFRLTTKSVKFFGFFVII